MQFHGRGKSPLLPGLGRMPRSQVREQTKCAGDSRRKLAIKCVGDIGKAALAISCLQHSTALGRLPLIVAFEKRLKLRVPFRSEFRAALLYPAVEIRRRNSVGRGEE